ncbi:sporulation histidine kinase inhibitor Sda [Paenibacillus sp. NPDC057967]|uniref:sporulation histidine kinase inhibitor Sda n=1 Tax=Paenibacillus sp. NPDC057967 TaxID=3346293 RepID=UPI0036DC0213
MVMDSRYTIHQSKLPNDDLIQCYCEAVRYGCDPYFIRILANTITDRGLVVPEEGECGHGKLADPIGSRIQDGPRF